MHINYEFKARCADTAAMEERLAAFEPRFAGTDHQIDTYFNVAQGRLKLREGNIEQALIHYDRSDVAGAKQSNVLLYHHQPNTTLKDILIKSLGVKVAVDKIRKIYFVDNIKFHFDQVAELGSFVEVEAIDMDGTIGLERLQAQCTQFAELFGIRPEDYVAVSYSDLLLAKKSSNSHT